MNPTKEHLQALLRQARRERRLSQLELSMRLGVSQRHVSFVESGRSRPSRPLLMGWLQVLDVPLSMRNTALQHAGFAPAFAATALDDPQLAHIQMALAHLLRTHEPMPALVIGPQWDILHLNCGAAWLAETLMPGALNSKGAAPPNMLDLLLHPEGLLCRLVNLGEAGADFLAQLRADLVDQPQLAPRIEALAERLAAHLPATGSRQEINATSPLLTLRFDTTHGELAFFRMFSTFGSPRDITLTSLRVEHMFAADAHTHRVLTQHVAYAIDSDTH
jgi:transcriptional regulator with XRE-family HTH domain